MTAFTDATMTFHEACATVLARCPDGYAKSYAKAGMNMYDPDAQYVQALYILNNIAHWRGEDATVVRNALKRIAKTGRDLT